MAISLTTDPRVTLGSVSNFLPGLRHIFGLGHFLTLRAYAVLLIVVFLLTGPVPDHADLFAAVLGYSLVIITVLAVAATFIVGWWFRTKLSLSFTYDLLSSNSYMPTSGMPISIFFRVKGPSLPPLFGVSLTPHFTAPLQLATWKISGSLLGEPLRQEVTFPHRGVWELLHVTLELRDYFGFSRFVWSYRFPGNPPSLNVAPPVMQPRPIPAFTAQTTSGSELTELQRTEGEPFDIKRYHPSDGIRRILWKTYAKTGELLSRHPEPSMTPEGTVAIYLLCRTIDDRLAGIALEYLRELEDADFDLLVTGDGWHSLPEAQVANSMETARNALIQTAWVADETTTLDRTHALHELQRHAQLHNRDGLHRLVVFVSDETLLLSFEQHDILSFASEISMRGIETLWIVYEHSSPLAFRDSSGASFQRHSLRERNSVFPTLKEALLSPSEEELQNLEWMNAQAQRSASITRFIQLCETNGWNYQHID
ncbi:MAG: DUF58 domain-containing protein [Bdellovibrionales bacterium]|nr:DUF58 domain-containing protein [Bdellovibrionales bacterium]